MIVAGSTGSRGATRAFMTAVARLPQGALVLPGFDAELPAPVWERLGAEDPGAADHPQAGFRRLADALGFDPRAGAGLDRRGSAVARAQPAGVAGAAPGAGHRPVAQRRRGPRADAGRGDGRGHLDRGGRPARRGAGDRARSCARRPRPARARRSSRPTASWRAASPPSCRAGACGPTTAPAGRSR